MLCVHLPSHLFSGSSYRLPPLVFIPPLLSPPYFPLSPLSLCPNICASPHTTLNWWPPPSTKIIPLFANYRRSFPWGFSPLLSPPYICPKMPPCLTPGGPLLKFLPRNILEKIWKHLFGLNMCKFENLLSPHLQRLLMGPLNPFLFLGIKPPKSLAIVYPHYHCG